MSNEFSDVIHKAKLIQRSESGEIKIGHPGSEVYSILPQLFYKMQAEYPFVSVSLTENNEIEIKDALLNFMIDVGFTYEVYNHLEIQNLTLFSEPFSLVIPKSHWLLN